MKYFFLGRGVVTCFIYGSGECTINLLCTNCKGTLAIDLVSWCARDKALEKHRLCFALEG